MPRRVCWISLALLALAPLAAAQELADSAGSRGPRFLLAAALHPVPVDVSRTPVLRQRLSLDLADVPLKEALMAIAQQSGLDLVYSDDVLPSGARVSLRAQGITVAAALTDVLADADVDVVFSRNGRAALVARAKAGVVDSGSVRGKVTDAKSGQPIARASVVLAGTRWRGMTDENGQYRLTDVTAATYTLTASRIGYAKQSQSVTVVRGQEVTVDVALQVAATELEQVVVTGTVVPTERKAIPTPISVVTAEDIQRQNLQRVDQLFRGQVPGAVAWDQGPFDGYSTIFVRGVSSLGTSANAIKTFIDGVEVADPQYIALIDPASVDRIEIIRGPQASTLYGAGALNGVMQIFTKTGQFGLTRPELTGKFLVGSVGGFDGQSTALEADNAISVLGGAEKTSYSIGGSYRRIGEWVPSYHSADGGISAGGQTSQGPLTLSSSLRYEDKTLDFPWDTRFRAYTPYSQPPYNAQRIQQHSYGVTASWRATRSWNHTLTLGSNEIYNSQHQTQPRFTTPSDSTLTVITSREANTSLLYHTDLSLRLGAAAAAIVTGGVNHASYDFIYSYTGGATQTTGTLNGSTYFITRTPWTNTGYFGQVQLNFRERLFLTGGLRAERSANFGAGFGTAWSPRAGASYVVGVGSATVKLRASYGESIRAPGGGWRDRQVSPFSIQLANPALAPERQRGADGGVEVNLGGASLGVTYYTQRVIDLIEGVPIATPPGTLYTFQLQNVDRVKNEGWEVEGRLPLGPVQVAGTYSITHSTIQELRPGYPAGGYQVGDPIRGVPRTSAGATVTYSPLPQTTLTATLTHIGHWTDIDYITYYAYVYGGQPYRGSNRAYWMEYPTVTKFAVGVSQGLTKNLTAVVRAENVGNNLRYEKNSTNIPTPRSVLVGANVRY